MFCHVRSSCCISLRGETPYFCLSGGTPPLPNFQGIFCLADACTDGVERMKLPCIVKMRIPVISLLIALVHLVNKLRPHASGWLEIRVASPRHVHTCTCTLTPERTVTRTCTDMHTTCEQRRIAYSGPSPRHATHDGFRIIWHLDAI